MWVLTQVNQLVTNALATFGLVKHLVAAKVDLAGVVVVAAADCFAFQFVAFAFLTVVAFVASLVANLDSLFTKALGQLGVKEQKLAAVQQTEVVAFMLIAVITTERNCCCCFGKSLLKRATIVDES